MMIQDKTTVRLLVSAIVLGPMFNSARAQWESLNGGVTAGVVSFCPDPDGEYLLVGGNFPWVLEDSLRVNNIAAWTGSAWTTEMTGGGNGDTSIYGDSAPVNSMVYWHDTLYVGATDGTWQMDPDMNFGAYLTEGEMWHSLPSQPSGPVFFYSSNGHLYMGGNGNQLGTEFFPGVCEVVGGQFVALPNNPLTGADIWATEYWQGSYYFGGQISTLDVGSRNIVRYDGIDQWTPVLSGIGGNFVRSIKGYGDSLYVGGYFLPGTNVQSTHLQIWDGTAWHPFFPDVVQFTSQVFEMEVYDGFLWILGNYQFSPDGPVYGILRFDGQQLCAIGGPCPSGDNTAIEFFQDHIYMGTGVYFTDLEYERVARLPLQGLVPDECHEVVTSIPDPADKASIVVLPNPATDQVTIMGLGGFPGSMLDVVDVLGRRVLPAVQVNAPSLSMDVGGLPAGCYQMELTIHSGKVIKRFMKR